MTHEDISKGANQENVRARETHSPSRSIFESDPFARKLSEWLRSQGNTQVLKFRLRNFSGKFHSVEFSSHRPA